MRTTLFDAQVRSKATKIIGLIPYNSPSRDLGGFQERIARGAFAETLQKNERVISLWQHQSEKPLGNTDSGTLRLKDSYQGLHVTIEPGPTSWGKDALAAVARGDVNQLSFGFRPRENGENWVKSNLRELTNIQLLEISPVTWAAYPEAIANVRERPGERVELKEAKRPLPIVGIPVKNRTALGVVNQK